MTKLDVLIAIALVLLTVSNNPYGSPAGEKPTFTDCRPHIDATIRNLASKAVKSGEEPTEPQRADYVSSEPSDEPLSYVPRKINIEEIYEEKSAKHEHQVEKLKKYGQRTENPEKSEPKIGQPVKQTKKDNQNKHQNDKHKTTLKKEKHSKKYNKEKLPENKKEKHHNTREERGHRQKSEGEQKYHPKHDGNKRDDGKRNSKVSSKKNKESASIKQPGLFNQFIGAVFGTTEIKRDEKYATPWTTHEEFIRLASKAPKKTTITGPGPISRLTNKFVRLVFGLSEETKRDKKWKKPWLTHKEFVRRELDSKKVHQKSKQKPWENKGIINFSVFNSFVELVFGKVNTHRDEKFSKPWMTHEEFQSMKGKSADKGISTKPKVMHSKPTNEGMFNFLVSLIFERPSGHRDPKFAKPWQTHEEFARLLQKNVSTKKEGKEAMDSGIFGNLLNKAVLLIFEKPTGRRSNKWKKPWQTHIEFASMKMDKKSAKVATVKPEEPGFISKAMNSFVALIFGKNVSARDPKFATPWQTHEEFTTILKSDGKSKKKNAQQPQPKYKVVYAKEDDAKDIRYLETIKDASEDAGKSYKQTEKKPYDNSNEEYSKSKTESRSAEKKAAINTISRDHRADASKMAEKHIPEKVTSEKKERKEKVIEYDDQIVVVPSHVRSREHIDTILGLDKTAQPSSRSDYQSQSVLKELKGIYETTIAPLEKIYKYLDISNRHFTDAELYGPPIILLLGPYSTGKSSFINYLLGVEFTKRGLKTGTPPSHGAFRIIQYGENNRNLDGTELSGQWLFSSLQKFGQNFVDQLRGKSLDIPLLKKATFVEAPGVLEMRRPNERLYPFNDVLQWFIDRADLILVMFDYTKLDAGYEMEAILDQLKGREAQTRILLNKADQVPPEELIKVQGSLFWNLSPLLGVNAPPIVYAGSYASFQYRSASPIKLFEAQEEALLHDIASAFNARVNNRIAIVRRHAVRVRNHAQMVDSYLNTYYKNKGFLTSKHKLADEITDNPHDYNIYEGLTLRSNVSRYDLPDAEIYRDFFRIHNLYDFQTLRQTCSYIGGCPLDKIDNAINKQLPELMKKYRQLMESGGPNSHAPPTFGQEKSSHAGVHARTGKL